MMHSDSGSDNERKYGDPYRRQPPPPPPQQQPDERYCEEDEEDLDDVNRSRDPNRHYDTDPNDERNYSDPNVNRGDQQGYYPYERGYENDPNYNNRNDPDGEAANERRRDEEGDDGEHDAFIDEDEEQRKRKAMRKSISSRNNKKPDNKKKGVPNVQNRFCCPWGPRLLWPMFWISAATTCTYYAAFECTFFKVQNLGYHDMTITYGLWTTEEYTGFRVVRQDVNLPWNLPQQANQCATWSAHQELEYSDVDAALSFARVVSAIACVLAAILWFWIMLASFMVYRPGIIRIACCTMLATALFMSCSFWCLKSSYCEGQECKVDFAGWVGVAAILLWLIAICATCYLLREPSSGSPFTRRKRRRRKNKKDSKDRDLPMEDEEEDEEEEEEEPEQEGVMVPYGYPRGYSDYPPEEDFPPEAGVMVPFGGVRDGDFQIDSDEDDNKARGDGLDQQVPPYEVDQEAAKVQPPPSRDDGMERQAPPYEEQQRDFLDDGVMVPLGPARGEAHGDDSEHEAHAMPRDAPDADDETPPQDPLGDGVMVPLGPARGEADGDESEHNPDVPPDGAGVMVPLGPARGESHGDDEHEIC